MKNLTKEEILYLSKISLKLQRYDDMKALLKKLLISDEKFGSEEINLFCIAYKHIINTKRSNYRLLLAQYELERKHKRIKKQILLEPKLHSLRKEIEVNCREIISVLKKFLETNPVTTKVDLIYMKMHADFHRYLAETATGDELQKAKQSALSIYEECYEKSKKELPKIDPVRLGIALSYSTLYSDILEEPNKACLVAKRAFQEALTELDTLFDNEYSDEEFNEVIVMIQGLRDQGKIFYP